MISQAKKNAYEMVDSEKFFTLRRIISEKKITLDKAASFLNKQNFDNISIFLKEELKAKNIEFEENNIRIILQNLIKEGFIYFARNNSAFVKHCQKSYDALYVLNSIFLDSKIDEQDISFLYQQFLFSPEQIADHFSHRHTANDFKKQKIPTLLHLDSILTKHDFYIQNDKPLIIKHISSNLAAKLFYGEITWQDIITSPLNEYLQFKEEHLKYFLMNNRQYFERQFTYLEKEDLSLMLETAPSLIGNQEKWLIEILIEHYEDISDLQDDDAQALIDYNCLKIIMDKTHVSFEEKTQILYRLLKSMDQFIFFANRQGIEMRDFSHYKEGVKLLISDIEKEVILSQCLSSPTEAQTIKKRM